MRNPTSDSSSVTVITPQLKFLISNIKNLVTSSLTADNYPLWRSQVVKIFSANGFMGFLDGSSNSTNQLTDQHLASALCSVITPTILPYVLSLNSCSEIWSTLALRLQSTTRSRIIQLKNDLHHVTKGDRSMTAYLLDIKEKVDAMAAAGSQIDPEDVVLHTLNGLPTSYNSFKTAIRTSLQPIGLDDLYSLLCSEEQIILQEAAKELQSLHLTDSTTALTASRGRGRGRFNTNRGRRGRGNASTNNRGDRNPYRNVTCQICLKTGHSAARCWHRSDLNYTANSAQTALIGTNDASIPSEWFLDSGASTHLTADQSNLTSADSYDGTSQIMIGDGRQLPIQHTGNGILPTPSGNLVLNQINHVPNLSFNLLSVYQLTRDNNCIVCFTSHGYQIKDLKTGRVLLQGPCHKGLYSVRPNHKDSNLALLSINTIPDLWHLRLGHTSGSTLKHLSSAFSLNSCTVDTFNSCNTCRMAKSRQLPFSLSVSTTTSPFELVHSDVWGPCPTISSQGFRYFVSFIDDFTKFCWVFPLIQKSEVTSKFILFSKMVNCQFSTTLKTIRTDGGGEYLNRSFQSFCQSLGINHQYTCPYTPAQNGVAERKNRHILETLRSLLIHCNAPSKLWVEALHTAIYIINRLPTSTLQNMTPFEKLYKKQPSFAHFKIFGCLCHPWLRPYSKSKLSPISIPCVFIGYASQQKGYRCLDPSTGRVFTSRHVIFTENVFPFKTSSTASNTSVMNPNVNLPPLLLVPISTLSPNQNHFTSHTSQPLQTVASSANTHQNSIMQHNPVSVNPQQNAPITAMPSSKSSHPMRTRNQTGHLKPKVVFDLTHQLTDTDPTSFTQASKEEHWRKAMSQEFQALQLQGTWDLVPPQPDQHILGCKWIYRTKRTSSGTVSRYKARLVALGYNQEFGINYTDTFSPVAKIPTVRVLIVLALHQKWPIHQLDVSNAFLHGPLTDIVYMKQPPGFLDADHPTHVCKLNKALYGLKQAPRQWFETLTGFLHQCEFTTSHSDPSLLIYNKNKITIYILIYVDDILLTGNNALFVSQLLSKLHQRFQMRNLGTLHQFLGITAESTETGMLLHQKQYAEDILRRAGMQNCKDVATPTSVKAVCSSDSSEFTNPTLYRQLVGALQYLTLTRPDITYAVNKACQHMHKPTDQHFDALKRILRYLRGTIHYGLPITGSSMTLRSYADSDWAGDHHDRKSTTGYCNFLGDTLISWSVKKQSTIARSSTEAEYRAIAAVTTEIIWLRRLLQELNFAQSTPTTLYCDNTSAIALANNPVYHARTKHIEVDCHFIRDCIKNQSIQVHHISSKDQLADFFTKSLSISRFKLLANKLLTFGTSACRRVLEDKLIEPSKNKKVQV
ncbi:Retrovirus-related Pol polyprotein from transposon TNT 1-94 [Dendrobium catenatum]|uniref:Retrovirus-related Pol polyprotein from transposon TNT 1-94 n=1 Tax=Dendrobium catenatum TaxID=906689 RepID=A0A2I0X1H4_9ASPA|nr:Retrovirus-related Pol polyprotein from transposon TNT 1-94 [Dendrobium catenatum]